MLDAMWTVSPNRQNLGILLPTTPATTEPAGMWKGIVEYQVTGNKNTLQKSANDIPLITIEYHSVSFSTIGTFNDISVVVLSTVI